MGLLQTGQVFIYPSLVVFIVALLPYIKGVVFTTELSAWVFSPEKPANKRFHQIPMPSMGFGADQASHRLKLYQIERPGLHFHQAKKP